MISASGCASDVAAPYDEATDFPMQVMLLRLFARMNQDETIAARVTSLSDAPGVDALDDTSRSFLKAAKEVYVPLVELERRHLLGEPVDTELAKARENLQKVQKIYFGGYKRFRKELALRGLTDD